MGGEERGCTSTPLVGDLHLREIMRQLHYMGEVSSPGVGMGGEGKGLLYTNQPPSWRYTSERDYETTTLYGRSR